jgi:YidC/Oxa1 family membrane protein insertase
MRDFFAPVLNAFSSLLGFIHDLVEPAFGVHSWGWAIIGLTVIVRVALLPLAIKQTRSMKAVQRLQPQMKAIQDKYKTDREMMRKDPERYKARRSKLNEEMMALYQREGANPAASCLPLLAQAPVFLALFWTLQGEAALRGAPFYFITSVGDGGLEMIVSAAGWPGWLLILLMSGSLFVSQKQMMARNAAAMVDSPMAQQQKILLYVMPIFLAAISFGFPLGILLYWVTTNLWQIVQQWIILRETGGEATASAAVAAKGGASGAGGATGAGSPKAGPGAGTVGRPGDRKRSGGATSGRRPGQGDAAGGSVSPGEPSTPDGTPDGASIKNSSSTDGAGPQESRNGSGNGQDGDESSGAPSARPQGPRDRLPRRGERR